MAVCFNCGKNVSDSAKICTGCGMALTETDLQDTISEKVAPPKKELKAPGGPPVGMGYSAKKDEPEETREDKSEKRRRQIVARRRAAIASDGGASGAPQKRSRMDPGMTRDPSSENAPGEADGKEPSRISAFLGSPRSRLLLGTLLLLPGVFLPWLRPFDSTTISSFNLPVLFLFSDNITTLPQLTVGLLLATVLVVALVLSLSGSRITFSLQALAFISIILSVGALILGVRFLNAAAERGPLYSSYVSERTHFLENNKILALPSSESSAPSEVSHEAALHSMQPAADDTPSKARFIISLLGPGCVFPILGGLIILISSMIYAPVMRSIDVIFPPALSALLLAVLLFPVGLYAGTRLSPSTWYSIQAAMFIRMDKMDVAEGKLTECVTSCPEASICEVGLARIFWKTGRIKEAVGLYTKVVREHPAISSAHRDLGDLSFAGGDYWKATAEYRKYVALEPRSSRYVVKLSDSLIVIGNEEYGDGDYKKALRFFNEANELLESNNTDIALQYKIGDSLYHLKRKREALEHFKITADLQPDDFERQIYVGKIYEELGDYDDAIEYYNASIVAKPDNTLSYVYIGDIHRKFKKAPDAAREWYEKGIAVNEPSRGADVARARLKKMGK